MRLLIDGHNLIGQARDLSLTDPDDEVQLIGRLRSYAARTGHRVTVIFDRGLPGGSAQALSGAGVDVVFAPAGEPADTLIIGRIRRIRDRTAWRVVSSDRAILDAAARAGVRSQRAEEMAAELTAPPPAPASDPRQLSPSRAEVDAWLHEFSRGRRRKKK